MVDGNKAHRLAFFVTFFLVLGFTHFPWLSFLPRLHLGVAFLAAGRPLAWLGNAMQSNALHELYKLEGPLKEKGDEQLLTDWRRLTTSDHFYYMCTKYWADGDVHKYFSPYESPYDSYINFMNVLDNIQTRLRA